MKASLLAVMLAIVNYDCASTGSPNLTPDRLDELSYRVPRGWQRSETRDRQSHTIRWYPEQNENKESLVLIAPAVEVTLDQERLSKLLLAAQPVSSESHTDRVRAVTSPDGLLILSIQTEYTPHSAATTYTRQHALVVRRADYFTSCTPRCTQTPKLWRSFFTA